MAMATLKWEKSRIDYKNIRKHGCDGGQLADFISEMYRTYD